MTAQKKMVYVTANIKSSAHINKLDRYMKPYIQSFCDIIDIYHDTIDPKKYQLALVNTVILYYIFNKSEYQKLDFLKGIKHVVFVMHDLHDYSFNKNYTRCSYRMKNRVLSLSPILHDNLAKKSYHDIFIRYNVKYLISIYDCPEFEFFKTYFKKINKFYLINHGYPTDIFYPIPCTKIYDLLYYGADYSPIYPCRIRLAKLFQNKNYRFRYIDYSEKICEKKLAELINKSWLCIACVSNFSYFVRKYLEISACNSVVLGDINHQGYQILGTNMVYVDNDMTDQQIENKVKYYIDNKEILAGLSFNKLQNVQKENYQKIIESKKAICSSIINHTQCKYTYSGPKNIVIDKNLRHTKESLAINFSNKVSKQKLDPGLYVLVHNSKGNIDIHDMYTLVSDPRTYIKDGLTKKTYVAFQLKFSSVIKIYGQLLDYTLFRIGIFT